MTRRRSPGEGSIFFRESKSLWVAKITLPDGKSRVKYAKTQKPVREWLVAQQNALRQGTLPKDDTVTVSRFLESYIDTVKNTLRPKTLEAYSYLIRVHINPTVGSIRLAHLRPDHLQTLYTKKLESGLSRRTVQFIHSSSIGL
jgi:integrase